MVHDGSEEDDEHNCVPKIGRSLYTVDNAIKYSVISSVVPFLIVTILHIIYATSYPNAYNSNSSSVLLIILNVMCIIPYLSWLISIVLIVWFIVLFTHTPSTKLYKTGSSLTGGGRRKVLSDKHSVLSGDRTKSSLISSLLSSSQSTFDSYSRSSTFGSGSSVHIPDSTNDLSFSEMSQSISEFD